MISVAQDELATYIFYDLIISTLIIISITLFLFTEPKVMLIIPRYVKTEQNVFEFTSWFSIKKNGTRPIETIRFYLQMVCVII